ncbi:nucleoside deaminase [Allorhodopirellula solitaria]|uniref:tRNA-specific adenosine deaminase n=1 Tax=Allorhodopirellula solitaria TaxID=2527987 RepID=A0A5C5YK26_9BACT|nr:nucleoside deaminase [Allorhodopirellula solitaria]TWT75201.1 tRNA-specific adenosine deaminase [Allorhodopirellula solitaria]
MINETERQPESVTDTELTQWMKAALADGQAGVQAGENPFGAAVYLPSGRQIAVAHNTAVSDTNPTAHAEVNAIRIACQSLGNPSLKGCWLLATAQPCPMCFSAALMAGIEHIVFGADQAAVEQAGFGGLGVTSRELAEQCSIDVTLRGSILSEDCTRFLLDNRKDG